jgi:hypothetical protein
MGRARREVKPAPERADREPGLANAALRPERPVAAQLCENWLGSGGRAHGRRGRDNRNGT